jgi:hypothetical protein
MKSFAETPSHIGTLRQNSSLDAGGGGGSKSVGSNIGTSARAAAPYAVCSRGNDATPRESDGLTTALAAVRIKAECRVESLIIVATEQFGLDKVWVVVLGDAEGRVITAGGGEERAERCLGSWSNF